jgi:sporulation protein YlmC with PRC-barrel domain
MNQTTQKTPKLYRFGDLRGRQVFDDSGEEVGSVRDLFIDEEGQHRQRRRRRTGR